MEQFEVEHLGPISLTYAIYTGNLPIIRYLFDERNGEKPDIHESGDIALQMSAKYGHLAVVRFLLDERKGEKANIHAENDGALRRAAENGHLTVVRFLLDERDGERVNIHILDDWALRWSSARGHLSVVRFLLDERVGEKSNISAGGNNALLRAIEGRHFEVVDFLYLKYLGKRQLASGKIVNVDAQGLRLPLYNLNNVYPEDLESYFYWKMVKLIEVGEAVRSVVYIAFLQRDPQRPETVPKFFDLLMSPGWFKKMVLYLVDSIWLERWLWMIEVNRGLSLKQYVLGLIDKLDRNKD